MGCVLCVLYSSHRRLEYDTPHASPVIRLPSKQVFLVVRSIYLNRLCNISSPRSFPSHYAPITARRVLPNLGSSFGGSHRAVAAYEVKKVSGRQQPQIPLW
jgi:hypothetical protein